MVILNPKLTMKISYLYRNGLETINVSTLVKHLATSCLCPKKHEYGEFK